MPQTREGPVLICGLGSIGRRHLRNLRALGWTDVVLHRTGKGPPSRPGAEPRRQPDGLEALPTETSLEAALECNPVATIISNPTSLHMETALAAGRAGSHLLVEKPLSDSLDGVDELGQIVRQRGLVLLVGYQFRFHPTLEVVRDLVRDDVIGRPVAIRAWWGEFLPEWHPGEDYTQSYAARRDLGGGAILTLSHPLDYMRWILGPVASVSCRAACASDLHVEVEDVAEISLRFESGALGNLHLDYARQPPAHGLEIVGTRGVLTWDAGDGVARRYDPVEGAWSRHDPPADFERNDLFVAEMKHFLASIEGTEEPRCSLEAGTRTLDVALAALESARTGAVVKV